MKIRPVGADLLHADGSDQPIANSRFSQFCAPRRRVADAWKYCHCVCLERKEKNIWVRTTNSVS